MSSGRLQSPTIVRRVIEMQKLRDNGVSFAKIAETYGITRQYVYALIEGQ